MNFRSLRLACLLLAGAVFSSQAQATDPCNFQTGNAFSWDQVMQCYNSVPYSEADRDNAVAFLTAIRERSDLREVSEAQFGWRGSLAALGQTSFSSDFAMQMAITRNHKEFNNPHWRYFRPGCYGNYLGAFMPFDFGSTVTRSKSGKQQQIVFIESAAWLPDLYQSFTGIDARRYIGMKLVSINGVEALQHFRNFGNGDLRFDTNDGENFNEAMQNGAYSIRVSLSHDIPPDRAADVYVLENTKGVRTTVTMPWIFAPRSAFGLGQSTLPSNTSRFQQTCTFPSTVVNLVNRVQGSADPSAIESPLAREAAEQEFVQDLREKRAMTQRLRKKYGGTNGVGYFEVAPGNLNQPLTTVVPKANGAVAYAVDDKATIVRLNEFTSDWKSQVIAATEYACASTDRLVFDMRNNNGGYVDQTSWLTSHLFPERTTPAESSLVGSFLNSNPGRNELAARMSDYALTYFGPGFCAWGYEPACFVNPTTGQPLTANDWYTHPAISQTRGGKSESLTQAVSFINDRPDYVPGTDPIACPGKFHGSTLVILTNGTGASAGYFFPELIRDKSVFVSAGGFIGEPLVSGIARGGAVWGMNGFEAYAEQYFIKYFYGPALAPIPYLRRSAESYIEQPGIYTTASDDGAALFAEANSLGNVRIDVWADSPETDGYVYRKVISAVQAWKPGN
ncbi:MAG: S41 family peptidase [Gammaproteobacteria bacterium]|nr:S41 family peptidase [Gammaproteobacteria bacterium]